MSDEIVKCEMCRFWKKTSNAPAKGECRFNAPTTQTNTGNFNGQLNTLWPTTKGEDWCGKGKISVSGDI